jgi:hypothetical protein
VKLEPPKSKSCISQVWLQAVLDGDILWDQFREGYSIAILDEVISLVSRHGIEVRFLLCSQKRFQLLVPHFDPNPKMEREGNTYKGIEFRVSHWVPDDYLYVVGDRDPPNPKSVAVMVWRRQPGESK